MENSDRIAHLRATLFEGLVIPACPLALTADRALDERRQRALVRYYLAAGAGGLAVGVHTTQFEIHDPRVGLYRPVLELAAEVVACSPHKPFVRIAGLVGDTAQAMSEAEMARKLGYGCGLLGLSAFKEADLEAILAHCQRVAEVIPLFGFYLQPAVGGRVLPYLFWRQFAEIENVVAIKIAPFSRYQTLDVVRAVADAGRADEIALYTGNDDSIVADLLTGYRFPCDGGEVRLSIAGGLLGHWAVWTRRAVELLDLCKAARAVGHIPADLLALGAQITDSNAALFDAANGFAGCIAGVHEVLRRQGLLAGRWCLNPREDLSPGQMAEIDRVCRAYLHLNDDTFVAAHLDEWLA
ncbi:MAG: dihydrodipicolinate synthase family protein [Anaerolineae bacterium]|nr:dihydrodipicolinate synthase family protein [Anaerolineae bacterium]